MKTKTKQSTHTHGKWYITGPKIQEDLKQTYFSIQTTIGVLRRGTYLMPGFYYPHSVQTPEEMEANAKRIVKCVNMHDELVELLKMAKDKLKSFDETINVIDIELLLKQAEQE